MPPTSSPISLSDVEAAARRVAPHVLRTPLLFSERCSRDVGCDVHFKAENLQHVGAFKMRGAANAVFALDERLARRGVVTHSSGNHAAALARAAKLRGIPAHIVMPHNSARNKLEAVRWYGVEPVLCDPEAEARASVADQVQRETGATLIHSYDAVEVMAGQGTVGLEILEQLPHADAVFVPVGGGGLLSGMLTALKGNKPAIQVVAAEPEAADDASRSLKSGRIESPIRYDSIADGLRTPLGELTFPIIRDLVDDIVLVSESAIGTATRALAERAKLVAEPSGAVAYAALAEAADRFAGKRVVVVVSGGNVDFGNCQLGGL